MMSALNLREKKDQQMNVRFTAAEIAALHEIAEFEDRDLAYLVGFFTRWGMTQYARVGSLVALRKKNVEGEAKKPGSSIKSGAMSRLELRAEAKDDVQEERSKDRTSASGRKSAK